MGKVVNTFHPGIPDLSKQGSSFLAVLVKAEVGDHYAAYAGLVKLPPTYGDDYDTARERQAERVAQAGSKLTYKQCVGYFPAVKECQYS